MDKFDFPKILEATFTGVIEIIYFYIITIILFFKSPLKTWDRIYNEAHKSNSDFDFRNIGLSQPMMFFAISLIIFLYFMKILIIFNYLDFDKNELNRELQPLFLKLIESFTNIYEFNITLFVLIILIANLVFSILYWILLDALNKNDTTIYSNILYKIAGKIYGHEIKAYHEIYMICFSKTFNIHFNKRQDNPFSINWADINSIHRFIAISNFISGILILLLIMPFIILINDPSSIFIIFVILIPTLFIFVPAWFMSIYSIQNDKSEV